MKKCVFSGTFDPPTVGHVHIVDKCLELFDKVVIAVMINPAKTPMLSVQNRVSLLRKLFAENPRIKVRAYYGTAADLLIEEETKFYVRGVRNSGDFEYENLNYYASKKFFADITALYIPADQDELHISSSVVKNCIKFGKDYSEYVPETIIPELQRMIADINK